MEHDDEPVRGLPGPLPAGETILWQGAPHAATLARTALKTRWAAGYFAAFALIGLGQGSIAGALATAGAGLFCLVLLGAFAWGVSRTTVYTLTNRRLVLRIGVALTVCYNLPLKALTAGDLRPLGNGFGDIALSIGGARIGYALLWPHVRPWRLRDPQPMLRAIPDAEAVAARLVRARATIGPIAPVAAAEPTPILIGAAA